MNPAKLHSALVTSVSAKSVEETPVPVIVKVRRGPFARGEVRALGSFGAEREFKLLEARSMSVTPSQIAQLTDDPSVDMIWPDLPVHTWLDEAVPLVRAPRVWDSAFTGRGVKVAILDTGIDGRHPDFSGRIAAYKDFIDPGEASDAAPSDPNGHGTHVAGIAAGSGAGSGGRWRGVAPEADLLIARVLDAAGNGRTSTVMAGIEWAVEQGARIINISLGGPPFPSDGTDALSFLCNAAVDQGVVVCAAAGNLGPSGHTVGSPGAAEKAITIGACEGLPDLGGDRIARFSSRGPTADGRGKPDLVFPGVGIAAPRSHGTSLGEVVDERYTSLSGTSQATPMATGSVALLLQANPRLSPSEVKQRLIAGAHPLPEIELLAQGAGRGDAYNAFASHPGEPLAPPDAGRPAAEPGAPAGCLAAATTAFLLR